jgi:hypothetical protein
MLNDRENILNVLREKPLKVYEILNAPMSRMRKSANPSF